MRNSNDVADFLEQLPLWIRFAIGGAMIGALVTGVGIGIAIGGIVFGRTMWGPLTVGLFLALFGHYGVHYIVLKMLQK